MQKLALWRRMSMTAGSLQTVHFTRSPPEMTGRISTVSVSWSSDVAGHEGVADDHEHRLAVHVEAVEERVHPHRAVDLQLARRVAQQHPHGATRGAAWCG